MRVCHLLLPASLCLLLSQPTVTLTAPQGRLNLQIGALRVAPATDPDAQLLRVRMEGNVPRGPWTARVEVPGEAPVESPCGSLSEDMPFFTIPVKGVEAEVDVKVTLWSKEAEAVSTVRLRPLRPWTIYIVQHTHTDMGYTDFPSRLSVDHIDFIEEAIRACDHTDDLPDAAKFRWTCEATWAVERLFAQRPPALIRKFLERVRQGRIEVTAMQMNMTDLATEEVVVRSFYPVARLRRHQIPIRTAMQCDVNGYPWALPELLEDIGIEGFAGGINVTRSTLPFDFPRAVKWESPSGGRVLTWRGEHYMMANFIGFQDSIEKVLSKLPSYLTSLEDRGYPYDAVLLQMAGYFTDNAAPSYKVCHLVRDWNERFSSPRVRVATLSDFIDALGPEPEAPVVRKAWPDWWADGVGSAALETALIRSSQETLSFAEAFLALARIARPQEPDWSDTIREAYLRASLYDEHTFGAAESISSPFTINSKIQWAEKSMNAFRTSLLTTELESAALDSWSSMVVPRGQKGLAVFNSLCWERSGPVSVRVSRGLADENTPFRLVEAESGQEVPYQIGTTARNFREVAFVAHDVPAVGYRLYRLETGVEPAEPEDPFLLKDVEISNGLTRVRLDADRAAIASIIPEGTVENIVDTGSEHAFNQYLHERIVHEKSQWYLWPTPAPYDPSVFERSTPVDVKIAPGSQGLSRRSLLMTATVALSEGEVRIETEVSLYRGLPGVYIENRVHKPEVLAPEASYFAFPFAAPSRPRADLVGGVMVPGLEQIPRSADDWHCIQRWVRFAGGGRDAVWVTLDAPLVQFGGLNTGRYGRGLHLEKPLLYSWVMNNYWFTNFLASQRGDFVFRYAVAGGREARSDQAADRFGRAVCSPLRAAAVEGRGDGTWKSRSLLEIEPPDIALVALKKAAFEPGGLVVRVRNYSGKSRTARIRPRLGDSPTSATRTSIIETPRESVSVSDDGTRIDMEPWGLETILFRWK